MAANWETNEALKNANAQVQAGIDGKDNAQVAAGMAAQQQALGDMGIVMPTTEGRNAAIKEAGGVVPSGGVSYAAAGGGKGGRSQGMVDELKGLYGANSDYARALAQMRAANDAAVQQTVGELTAQKAKTNQSYADMFRQLYIQRKNAQKNMGQRLAAQGINGGASESSMLELETGYSEALRQGEQERINAQNELDRAISEAQLTGKIQNAQATLDGVREQTAGYAGVLQGLLNRQDSWDMHDENMEYQKGRDVVNDSWRDTEWKHQLETEGENETIVARDDARGRIDTFLQAGGTVDELYAALGEDLITKSGLTRGELEQIAAYYKQQNAPKVSYTGGGDDRRQVGEQDYEGLYQAALASGYPKAFIANNYKEYGFASSSGLYDGYGEWSERQENESTPIAAKKVYPNGSTVYQWNGRGYNVLDFMLRDFQASNPSDGDVRRMNAFLESIGSKLELAYE